MKLFLNRPAFFYEMENLCRLFLPHESFSHEETPFTESVAGDYAVCDFAPDMRRLFCGVRLADQTVSQTADLPPALPERELEIEMARGLYRLLSKLCGFSPPWGVLTGVRPAKLYSSLLHETGSAAGAQAYMQQRLYVQPEKIALCGHVMAAEEKAAAFDAPNAFSLYVSIPFCPTRCSYCSFVSHSVEKTAKMVPEYVSLLCDELAAVGQWADRLGLSLKTVYFGGGTPTQLTPQQSDAVLQSVKRNFDLSHLLEYTVEAGRPDTVTAEKLAVLKQHGVTRISINPQTMHDSVLAAIGRRHTVQQVVNAFSLARSMGFNNINMDLIAGLPTDTPAGFAQTLDQILAMGPENVTVHTLAVKRAARLAGTTGARDYRFAAQTVSDMLHTAAERLTSAGFAPYYLYRQSKMFGNFENVGWTLPGRECYYNLYMMNEMHTVLAAGAGAVTRLKEPGGPQISRIFNYKYPYEYCERFATVLQRKQGIGEFYEQYPIHPSLSTG